MKNTSLTLLTKIAATCAAALLGTGVITNTFDQSTGEKLLPDEFELTLQTEAKGGKPPYTPLIAGV